MALIPSFFNEESTQQNNSHQFSNMALLFSCLKMNESKTSSKMFWDKLNVSFHLILLP